MWQYQLFKTINIFNIYKINTGSNLFDEIVIISHKICMSKHLFIDALQFPKLQSIIKYIQIRTQMITIKYLNPQRQKTEKKQGIILYSPLPNKKQLNTERTTEATTKLHSTLQTNINSMSNTVRPNLKNRTSKENHSQLTVSQPKIMIKFTYDHTEKYHHLQQLRAVSAQQQKQYRQLMMRRQKCQQLYKQSLRMIEVDKERLKNKNRETEMELRLLKKEFNHVIQDLQRQ